jgi:sugar lactone lactonase YvrE
MQLMQSRKVSQISSENISSDGMIFDENGTLYFADLENNNYVSKTRWQYSHISGR